MTRRHNRLTEQTLRIEILIHLNFTVIVNALTLIHRGLRLHNDGS